jgi:PBP1b-binding outer membrane lipoprotein LpoB
MTVKKLLSMIMTILLVSALVLGGCAKKETKKATPTPAEPNKAAATK